MGNGAFLKLVLIDFSAAAPSATNRWRWRHPTSLAVTTRVVCLSPVVVVVHSQIHQLTLSALSSAIRVIAKIVPVWSTTVLRATIATACRPQRGECRVCFADGAPTSPQCTTRIVLLLSPLLFLKSKSSATLRMFVLAACHKADTRHACQHLLPGTAVIRGCARGHATTRYHGQR